MDIALDAADRYIFTPYVYPVTWPESDPWRQITTLLIISNLGTYVMYFFGATVDYFFVYDQRLLSHPRSLQNQMRKEIMCTVVAVPVMSIPTVAMFFLEVRGYSKLYDNVEECRLGYAGLLISIFTFVVFLDMGIYWIHRGLHHKYIYKSIHKLHHKWKVPTPFASLAFHPLDGFLQSLPLHIYPFIFPLHKMVYLSLFSFFNFWSVSAHDGTFQAPDFLKPFINSSAHHMEHHLHHNYNYGQFFTFWDRVTGSFKTPSMFEGCGPLDQVLGKARMTKKVTENMKTEVHWFTNGNAKKME